MIKADLRSEVAFINEYAVLFDNPSYDDSIIGMSDEDRVVYSLDKMVNEFMKDNNVDYEEAYDFISYNTVRALGYWSMDYKPIILVDSLFGGDNE